jgi:hypothetical protein
MLIRVRQIGIKNAGKHKEWKPQKNSEEQNIVMIAYEFYRRVPLGEDRLIGVLPERRRKAERITRDSIMNWAKMLVITMPEDEFHRNVYFLQIEI